MIPPISQNCGDETKEHIKCPAECALHLLSLPSNSARKQPPKNQSLLGRVSLSPPKTMCSGGLPRGGWGPGMLWSSRQGGTWRRSRAGWETRLKYLVCCCRAQATLGGAWDWDVCRQGTLPQGPSVWLLSQCPDLAIRTHTSIQSSSVIECPLGAREALREFSLKSPRNT